MIGANLGQAIMLSTIVALAVTHVLTLPILVGAVFVTGTLTVTFDLSYNAYLSSLVVRLLLGAIGLQSTIVWTALSALPKVKELPPSAPAQPESDSETEPEPEPSAEVTDPAFTADTT